MDHQSPPTRVRPGLQTVLALDDPADRKLLDLALALLEESLSLGGKRAAELVRVPPAGGILKVRAAA